MWKYKVYRTKVLGIKVQLSPTVAESLRGEQQGYTSSELPLRGLYIVITGTLWDTRSRIYNMIREAGGYPQDRVDSSTNLLVIGERPGNTKLNAARDRYISYTTSDELDRVIHGTRHIDDVRHSVTDYLLDRNR